MNPRKDLAARMVTGVIAAMVTAAALATVVGFWLSYGGLHSFAVGAGMSGAEAWAWPASVDLFIIAGEAGVTISVLRRRRDPLAWCYLAAGIAASVTGNALHVHAGHLPWAPYAVAIVPPLAAMAALAALLRHVYRLALDAHLESAPGPVPESAPASAPVPVAAPPARPAPRKRAPRAKDPRSVFAAELESGTLPSDREVRTRMSVGGGRAKQIRLDLEGALAMANGNGKAH